MSREHQELLKLAGQLLVAGGEAALWLAVLACLLAAMT